MKRNSGFTLLELLIVIIILGILAAIALPKFTGATEKARITEAVNMMTHIREAEASHNISGSGFTNNLTTLGFVTGGGWTVNPTNATGRYFTITFDVATPTTIIATRNSIGGATYNGNTIRLFIENGSWDSAGTHPLKPTNET